MVRSFAILLAFLFPAIACADNALAPGSYTEDVIDSPTSDGENIFRDEIGNAAIVDGSVEADPNEWSLSAHGDAAGVVYEILWPHTLTNDADGNGIVRMWVDGVQIDFATSVANCAATPGSFFCPFDASTQTATRPGANNPILIYYHPAGSTDPTSDGRAVRIVSKAHCIWLGDDCTLTGLELRRCFHFSGPVKMGLRSIVRDCLIDSDAVHGCVIKSGAIYNSIFGPPYRTTYPSTLTNGYVGWYDDDPTGYETLMQRVVIIGSETFAGMTDNQWGQAITQHSAGAQQYLRSRIRGLILYHVFRPSSPTGETVDVQGVYAYRCREGIFIGGGPACTYNDLLIRCDGGVDANSYSAVSVSGDHTYNDACIYTRGANARLFNLNFNATTIRFNNLIFVNEPGGGTGNRQIASSNGSTSGVNFEFNNCLIITRNDWAPTTDTGATWSGSRNVVISIASSPTDVGQMSTQTNLFVSKTSGHGFTTDEQIFDLTHDIFNGDNTNPADGDFRTDQSAIQTINGGNFPDAQPIANYTIGARTHWDFDRNQSVSGPPSAWPTVPITYAERQRWVRGGMTQSTRDKNGRYLRTIAGERIR